MFPHPCLPSRHARVQCPCRCSTVMGPPSSYRSQLVKGSTCRPRLELGTASAPAPVCCVCVCVCVLCLRMRLRLHLDYTCGACSLHSATATAAPLSCPGGVLSVLSVCLSAGPPCPPRRCISVPSLRVGYSTDDCMTTCTWVGVLSCDAVCVYHSLLLCPLLLLLPLQPLPRACACACSLYRTLTPRVCPPPSFGAPAAPATVQLQIPSIAHEHAAALLPHPVPIYLSLPCLPRLNRLAPHAASTLVLILILTPSRPLPIPFLSSPSVFVPFSPVPSCPLLASEITSLPSCDWPPQLHAMPSTCV